MFFFASYIHLKEEEKVGGGGVAKRKVFLYFPECFYSKSFKVVSLSRSHIDDVSQAA